MSFLRHQETHQSDDLQCKRARRNRHALAHRADESPVGYSWRVALQQSPLPLHQPVPTLRQWRDELQERDRCNLDPTLTCGLTLGAHPIQVESHQRSWWIVHTQPRSDENG